MSLKLSFLPPTTVPPKLKSSSSLFFRDPSSQQLTSTSTSRSKDSRSWTQSPKGLSKTSSTSPMKPLNCRETSSGPASLTSSRVWWVVKSDASVTTSTLSLRTCWSAHSANSILTRNACQRIRAWRSLSVLSASSSSLTPCRSPSWQSCTHSLSTNVRTTGKSRMWRTQFSLLRACSSSLLLQKNFQSTTAPSTSSMKSTRNHWFK